MPEMYQNIIVKMLKSLAIYLVFPNLRRYPNV